MFDFINLLGVLCCVCGSFVIVINEFGVVQGLVMLLDVLEVIVGEFLDVDEMLEIVVDVEGWIVKGGIDFYVLQQVLEVDYLVNEEGDIVMVVGLVIVVNGYIFCVGDVIDVLLLWIIIVEVNDYCVDLVWIVKEQFVYDEEE